MVRVFLRGPCERLVMLIFPSDAPAVARVRELWFKANTLSVASGIVAGVALVLVVFLRVEGVAMVMGWLGLGLLAVGLIGEIVAMYLMGAVTDDVSVIRRFRSDALSSFWWSLLVFVCGTTSLALTTFVH